MAATLPAGNDPFSGGGIYRQGAAGVGGSFSGVSSAPGNPITSVNAPAPYAARHNEGSNIGIPMARLVPLGNIHETGLALQQHNLGEYQTDKYMVDEKVATRPISETQDVRPTRLAFVLGKRSAPDTDGSMITDNPYNILQAVNSKHAPGGMAHVDRFQKLCSIEYLQRYFQDPVNGLGKLVIDLNTTMENALIAGALADPMNPRKDSGMLRLARELATAVGNADPLDGTSMLDVPDLCKESGFPDSPAATLTTAIKQGVFTHDAGPFLRGKGGIRPERDNAIGKRMVHGTKGGIRQDLTGGGYVDPFQLSRYLGDDVAFAALERLLTSKGLSDWRPDGIVLSKGANDLGDFISDEQLNARDGQLFNLRIQGPALSTSWIGDPTMQVMPLDKVFVVIVADVWWGDLPGGGVVEAFLNGPSKATYDAYHADDARWTVMKKVLRAGDPLGTPPTVDKTFAEDAKDELDGTYKPKTRLANFRLRVATSSQMVNCSAGDGQSGDPTNRMGLRRGTSGGEYIIGGWCIGNVLDTAASRATFPDGSSFGFRSAPNSAALNVNVQIEWWDADRMYRSFMNMKDPTGKTTGTIKARYEQTVKDLEAGDINYPR